MSIHVPHTVNHTLHYQGQEDFKAEVGNTTDQGKHKEETYVLLRTKIYDVNFCETEITHKVGLEQNKPDSYQSSCGNCFKLRHLTNRRFVLNR